MPCATPAPWSEALSCVVRMGVAVPAQAVPGAAPGAVTSTTSLISLSSSSCTKGTFGDTLLREKRGRRAGKGAAQSLGQHLVQDTLRLVSWTATGDGSVAIPCTHLVLQHLQGSRTLVQPWPLGRCP